MSVRLNPKPFFLLSLINLFAFLLHKTIFLFYNLRKKKHKKEILDLFGELCFNDKITRVRSRCRFNSLWKAVSGFFLFSASLNTRFASLCFSASALRDSDSNSRMDLTSISPSSLCLKTTNEESERVKKNEKKEKNTKCIKPISCAVERRRVEEKN